jgi:hypothetical protein
VVAGSLGRGFDARGDQPPPERAITARVYAHALRDRRRDLSFLDGVEGVNVDG